MLELLENQLRDFQAKVQGAKTAASLVEKRAEAAEVRALCLERRAVGAEDKLHSYSVREAEAFGKATVLQTLADQMAEDQKQLLAAEQRASRAEAHAEMSTEVFEKLGALVKEIMALHRSNSASPRVMLFDPVPIKLEDVETPHQRTGFASPTAADAALAIAAADAVGLQEAGYVTSTAGGEPAAVSDKTPTSSLRRSLGFSFFRPSSGSVR